jgi:hypothetical protein
MTEGAAVPGEPSGPIEGLRLALGQAPDDAEIVITDGVRMYRLREVSGISEGAGGSIALHLTIEEDQGGL